MEKKKETNKNNTQVPNPTTSIIYKGSVKVSLIDPKNKILKKFRLHNEGLPDLFKGICSYLIGQGDRTYIPRKMDLIFTDGVNQQSILSTPSVITNSLYNEKTLDSGVTTCYDTFTAVISSSQLTDIIDMSKIEQYKLCLLGASNDIKLATINFPEVNLEAGLSIIIEWQLYISNATT